MSLHAGPMLRAWMTPRVRATDIAEKAKVSPQYVSAVLRGKKPPSEKLLEAARELGIPVDDLLGGEGHDRRTA